MKNIKVSSIIGILLGLELILLTIIVISNREPNIEIIKLFSDIAKILAGALAGAFAGEKL